MTSSEWDQLFVRCNRRMFWLLVAGGCVLAIYIIWKTQQ
jgi:hypothetical protein